MRRRFHAKTGDACGVGKSAPCVARPTFCVANRGRLRCTQSISCAACSAVLHARSHAVARQPNLVFAYTRIHVGTSRRSSLVPVGKNRAGWQIEAKNLYAQIPASSVTLPTFEICLQPDGVSRFLISAKSLGPNAWAYRTDLPAAGRICIHWSHRTPLVSACESDAPCRASYSAPLFASRRTECGRKVMRVRTSSHRPCARERRKDDIPRETLLQNEASRVEPASPQETHLYSKPSVCYTNAERLAVREDAHDKPLVLAGLRPCTGAVGHADRRTTQTFRPLSVTHN